MTGTFLRTESDAQAWGRERSGTLGPGAVVALVGELGAGKTQVAKGLAAGLGYASEVTSPTFPLVHEYLGGRLPVFHFDFFRLELAADVLALGWEEYLEADGVCVVEWADKFPELLPVHAEWWRLTTVAGGGRRVKPMTNDECRGHARVPGEGAGA